MIKIIQSEFLKYRRTIVPPAILGSALLTAVLGIFMADGGNWYASMANGLGWLNLLSLILISILVGIVFAGEYSYGTAKILFTYPIVRWKFYVAKLVVLFFWVISLYATFFLFSIFSGMVLGFPFPTLEVFFQALRLLAVLSVCNLVLAPLTALISILFREYIAFILAGILYVAIYFSFIRTNARYFLPMTIPNVIKDSYLASVILTPLDWIHIVVTLLIVFIVTVTFGLIYYVKRDA